MGLMNLEVTGVVGVQQHLLATQNAIQDLTAFWTDVFAPKYFAVVQDMFSTSGTPRGEGGRFSGAPWTSLTPLYAQWKYKVYPGMPILTASGTLRDSLVWTGAGLGPQGIWEAMPGSVRFGTSVPYAGAHQHGVPERNLPARPFLIKPDPAVFGPLMEQWIKKVSGWGSGA
jgi:phage gpG-like protein